jgi:hypothetical protein
MGPDDTAKQTALKLAINEFIWTTGPDRMTLKEAEQVATHVFLSFQRVETDQ